MKETMQISVKTDINSINRTLSNIQRKQLPFAISQALNDTAMEAREVATANLETYLDKPVPFTKRAIRYTKSTKRHLVATVQIAPTQYAYLKHQIKGGRRFPNRKAIPVPFKNQPTNQYGNLPRGTIGKLLAKPNTFSGSIKGVAGIWQRGHYSRGGKFSVATKSRSTAVRLLVAWEKDVDYQARYPYSQIVKAVVRTKFQRHLKARLAAALQSAN
jgi:hypothetical protein